MATLKLSSNYLNPYEAAQDKYKGSPAYQAIGGDTTWQSYAKEGNLDTLVTVLYDVANSDTGMTGILKEYNSNFDYLDSESKVAAIANSLYEDRDTLETYYKYTNADGTDSFYSDDKTLLNSDAYANYTMEEVQISAFDYTQSQINRYADYQKEQYDLEVAAQAKEDMNGFTKFMASVASIPLRVLQSGIGMLQNIGTTIYASGRALVDAAFGMSAEEVDERFRSLFEGNTWLEDELIEFESKYTYWRDIDGEVTNVGKVVVTLSDMAGEMLVTAAIGAIPGVGVAANFIYWFGMGVNNFREFVNDESMASVPTWQLVISSATKATLEYAVMKGLNAILGGGTLSDKLVFGYSTNWKASGIGSVAKKLLADAVHEGVEEVLQTFSNYFVDGIMSLVNSSFSSYAEFDIQEVIDAFVIGAIGSMIGGSLSLTFSKRISTNIPKLDKDGNVRYNRKGEVITEKFGKLESIITRNGVEEMFKIYDEIVSNNDLTHAEAEQLSNQLTQAYTIASQIYGEMGSERFQNANNLLNAVIQEMKSRKYDHNAVKTYAKALINQYNVVIESYYAGDTGTANITDSSREDKRNKAKSQDKAAEKVAEAKVSNIKQQVTRDDMSEITKESKDEMRSAIEKIMNDDPDVKQVLVAEKSEKPVQVGDTIIASEAQLKTLGAAGIQKSLAEQRLVENVASMKMYGVAIKSLRSLWNQLHPTQRISKNTDVLYQLFFNDEFFKIALKYSNVETTKLLTALMELEAIASDKSVADSVYKHRMEVIFANRAKMLVEYYVNQTNDNSYKTNGLFDKKTVEEIDRRRVPRNIYNKMIKGETLTTEEYAAINQRINFLPISTAEKGKLQSDLGSKYEEVRWDAVNRLDAAYRNIYRGPYNNITYLVENGLGDITWNVWAQKVGVTIKTIAAPIADESVAKNIQSQYGDTTTESIIKYYQQSFSNFTDGAYTFEYANGRVKVVENGENVETTNYKRLSKADYDRGHYGDTQTIVLPTTIPNELRAKYVNLGMDYNERITFDDMIRDSSTLSADAKKAIIAKYGKLNSRNTFLYLRDELATQGFTLSMSKFGRFEVGDIRQALSLLKSQNAWVKTDKSGKQTYLDVDKEYSIQEFIKPTARDEGMLKAVRVRFTTQEEASKKYGSFYEPDSNTIVLDRNAIRNTAYMNASLLHEYQHAIQWANTWNGGISSTWVTDYAVSKTVLSKMLTDVKKHVPELFSGVKGYSSELAVLQQFVYETSGESQALSLERSNRNTFFPTMVNVTQQNGYITMPWGTTYHIYRGGLDVQNMWSLRKDGSGKIFRTSDLLDPETYFPEYYHASSDYDATNKTKLTENDVRVFISDTNKMYVNASNLNTRNENTSQLYRERVLETTTPEAKLAMIQSLHSVIGKNIPFDTFYNMDIPCTRAQVGNNYMYDAIVPFTAGNDGMTFAKMLAESGDSTIYMFVGTFKPRDISNYIDAGSLNEILISPSKIKNMKAYRLSAEDLGNDISLKVESQYDMRVSGEIERFHTEKVPQSDGSIKVVKNYGNVKNAVKAAFELAYSQEMTKFDINAISTAILDADTAIFTPYGYYYSRGSEYSDVQTKFGDKLLWSKDDIISESGDMFRLLDMLVSVSYEAENGAIRVTLPSFVTEQTLSDVVKYLQRKAEYLKQTYSADDTFLIVNSTYYKFSSELSLEDTRTLYNDITGYIDEVNEYVSNKRTDSLVEELENIQPVAYESSKADAIKLTDRYSSNDIANFEANKRNIRNRASSEDAMRYSKIATTDENADNAKTASKKWLQEVTNLTGDDYVPLVEFTEEGSKNFSRDTYYIPTTDDVTYTGLGDGNWSISTSVAKISDLTSVDTKINSDGFIQVKVSFDDVSSVSLTEDIEIAPDKKSFTITNPEHDVVVNKQSFAKPKDKITFTDRWKAKRNLRGKQRDKARYISNKDAQGTIFQNFIKRNKRIQMDPALQDLLAEFDKEGNLDQVDKGLRKYIDGSQKGTLTIPVLYEYIRKAKSMNDYTFQAIAEHIFLNPNIKNFKQLKAYADISAADYFALRTVLRTFNKTDWLNKKMNYGKVTQLVDLIKSKEDWAALYEKVYNMYYLYRGAYSIDIDSADMRILFMKYYEGDIDSAADIASLARWKAIHNFNTAGNIATISMETAIGEDIKLEDTIADTASSEFISTIGGYVTEQEMMDAIKDHRYSKLYGDSKYLEMTDAELKAAERQIAEEVDDMTSEEIVKAYTTLQVAEESFMDDYYQAVDEAIAKEIKPERNLRNAIKRIANGTIKKHLSKDAMKRFLEENPNFYNENGQFNEDLFKGMSYNDIVNFHAQVLELSRLAQRGAFNSKLARSLTKKIDRQAKEIAKLKQEKSKLEEIIFKYENTETKKFSDDIEFTINSSIPMPGRLGEMIKNAINAGVSTASESQVKFVTEADTQNATVSMKKFVEANSEILGTLTQGEADDIIEFYANSMALQTDPTVSRNYYRAYQAYEIVVLTYLEIANRNSIINLTDEQIEIINNILNTMVSTATTIATTWRDAMKALNPTKVIIQSLRQSSGLEISEADVNSLVGALNLSIGDDIVVPGKDGSESTVTVTEEYKMKAISKAMHDIEEHVLEQYRQRQKHRTKADVILGKLHAFRKMAMLSSPGTAIRNVTSNAIVYGTNIAGGKIGTAVINTLRKIPGVRRVFKTDRKTYNLVKNLDRSKADKRLVDLIDQGGGHIDMDTLDKFVQSAKHLDDYTVGMLATEVYTESGATDYTSLRGYVNSRVQWQISGTKVDTDTKEFVDNFFNRSIYETTDSKGKVKKVTFYDAVADGLTKYDPRRQKRAIKDLDPTTQTGASFTETMAENMIQSVVNRVYQQHKFDSQTDSKLKKVNKMAEKAGKGLNKVSNMVYWLLQDDPFIKKMTRYYFERMLVEENVPLSQGLSSRTFDLFAEAYTKAAYDFMHKPNVFNKFEQYIHQKMGAGAHFMYTTLFPFASASWNWFVEGLNYTPIGLLKGIVQYAKLESTIQKMQGQIQAGDLTYSPKFASLEARKTVGKGVIGSIGMLIGILVGCAGWAGIDDEDGTLKLYVGDTYIDISSLFGSQGILMGLLMTSAKYDEDMTFTEGFMAVLDALFDDSVFNDLYNSFRYADSVSDWLLSNVEDAVGQFIPNFVKTFNSMLYTHQVKYSSGIRGTFEYWGVSLIPGLAYALPKVYDIYTGEVQSKYKLQWLVNFINKLSPVDIQPYNISDLEKEAIANGVSKSQLTGNYTDIGQLSAEQVSLLNQYYGTLNKSDLENFINNKSSYSVQNDDGTYSTLKYKQMTADQRKRVIERIMSNNATYAKIYIYTQIMGGKYYASDSTYTALKALGITKNVYKETTKLSGFN